MERPSETGRSRLQYLFDIYLLLYIQSRSPDDGRKDRPKHVQCYSKINKFEKLVHLVGFTMEKYITLFAGDQNDDTVTGPQLRVGRITLGDQQRLYPHCVYNHQASNSMGNRGSFSRVKRPGREANHFLPFSAGVRNGWSCILYVLMAWTEKTLAFFVCNAIP